MPVKERSQCTGLGIEKQEVLGLEPSKSLSRIYGLGG